MTTKAPAPKLSAPKTISSKQMTWVTHYDNMDNSERSIVFDSYNFNPYLNQYELKSTAILSDSIIKKLQSTY